MTTAHGSTTDRFSSVGDLFRQRVDNGEELGASLALDIDGERVIDLWGGFRDSQRTVPWTKDTLINVFSTTKLITTIALLVLVDRGKIDLDAPVASYWPEFAANGKEGVLVRNVMGHASGVSAWEQPIALEDLYDLRTSTARLAGQTPWWSPGTSSGYHLLTFGHLVGELVRRVDGRSLKRFVDEELAAPLGADVQIGAREQDWPRIAKLVPAAPVDVDISAMDQTSVGFRTQTSPVLDPEIAATPGWRRAEIGAANGHASADGLVNLLRAVPLGGTVGGVRLLSRPTIDRIFEVQTNGIDMVTQVDTRWGIGFAIAPMSAVPFLPDGAAWWGGMGGSIAFVDRTHHATFAYTPNQMGGGGDTGFGGVAKYIDAFYAAL